MKYTGIAPKDLSEACGAVGDSAATRGLCVAAQPVSVIKTRRKRENLAG
jgi:hypothetical protein